MSQPPQKALFLEKPGGRFFIQETSRPAPGPGDILVKVEATALNPVDWKIQATGFFFVTNYPAILGSDGAGVVVELGEGVTNVSKGDKILFQGFFDNARATFQQYSTISAKLVAKIPTDVITVDEAASVPLGLATASIPLYTPDVEKNLSLGLVAPWDGGVGKYKGLFVVLGGSSSVGSYAIQFARLSGFSPIIATASLHNTELLKSLGATHILDRTLSHSELVAEITNLAGAPVEHVFDAISESSTQNVALDVLAPGGTLIRSFQRDLPEDKTSGKTIIDIYGNVQLPQNRKFGAILYSNLTDLLASGSIKPNQIEVLPGGLAGISAGLERLRNNQVSGKKLIARPQETT